MMIDPYILITTVTSIFSGLIGYLSGRKMQKQLVKGSELDNVQKAVEIWRKLTEDLTKEMTLLKQENRHLLQQIVKLNLRIEELEKANEQLQNQLNK